MKKLITVGEPLKPEERRKLEMVIKVSLITAVKEQIEKLILPPMVEGSTYQFRPVIHYTAEDIMAAAKDAGVTLQRTEEIEEDVPPVDRTAVTTLRGSTIEEVRKQQEKQKVGMHADYIVLSSEERQKGFKRPVRRSYRHVGKPPPKHPLRDLTPEEKERYKSFNYYRFEAYPPSASSVTGRFWTKKDLESVETGCGVVTTMSVAHAETYARDPGFYGSTFCCGCNTHLPVGEAGEFVWDGTTERVGT